MQKNVMALVLLLSEGSLLTAPGSQSHSRGVHKAWVSSRLSGVHPHPPLPRHPFIVCPWHKVTLSTAPEPGHPHSGHEEGSHGPSASWAAHGNCPVIRVAHSLSERLVPPCPTSLILGTSKLRCYCLYCVFPEHAPKSGNATV